jgi:hypothetical protein
MLGCGCGRRVRAEDCSHGKRKRCVANLSLYHSHERIPFLKLWNRQRRISDAHARAGVVNEAKL